MENNEQQEEDKDDNNNRHHPSKIIHEFDKLCFEIGDQDAILMHETDPATSYFEIQEYSKILACQLHFRYRPDYVLLDCQGWPVAEAVSTLACMRLQRPFVPVSAMDLHRPGRMDAVVDLLHEKGKHYNENNKDDPIINNNKPSVVAVVVCPNDRDPILSVFQNAGVHQILYLNSTGMIQEQLSVPDSIPDCKSTIPVSDDMYVLFTSGTSSIKPKAVIGSHLATYNRLKWFLDSFDSSPRIARRSKLTFVDGVTELWGGLLDPQSVLVAVSPEQLQGQGIITLIEDMECTQLLLLPSQLNQLLLIDKKSTTSTLERCIVSGEVLSTSQYEKFRLSFPKTQLINLYGQTETTGDCLCADLTALGEAAIKDNVVAVGKPITDAQISSVEVGQDEEEQDKTNNGSVKQTQLVIRGTQLSNGYLGDGPFEEFFTGDIGFCNNGLWYVRGRADDIHKLNGVWTSPTEIESGFCKMYQVEGSAIAAVILDNQVYIICTDQKIVQQFSRLDMNEEGGIPWNLIPKRVFYRPNIPRTSSGAGKIDRKACLQFIRANIHSSKERDENTQKDTIKRKCIPASSILSIISSILGIDEDDLDRNKSFLELGGDSASAITLLYRLKQEAKIPESLNVTALDLMRVDTLNELENILSNGTGRRKKSKMVGDDGVNPNQFKEFKVRDPVQVDNRHWFFQLQACVDSSPLILGDSIVSACQGGVILKGNIVSKTVQTSIVYSEWLLQADLLPVPDSTSLIVCGHSLSEKGLVVCVSSDLKQEKWKIQLEDGPLRTRPLIVSGEASTLWVLAGRHVVQFNLETGEEVGKKVELPRPCFSSPVLRKLGNNTVLVYASSDWEGGLMVLDPEEGTVNMFLDCEIGPVHKEMTYDIDSCRLFVSDIYGNLHCVDLTNMEKLCSIQLSSYPLSTPVPLSHDNLVVVGSYDASLYCIKIDPTEKSFTTKWECDCLSSIYTKPLLLEDGRIVVVCTTAGDIFAINLTSGTVQSHYRIPGEIWSSPIQMKGTNPPAIAFGARDSRCHIVTIQ